MYKQKFHFNLELKEVIQFLKQNPQYNFLVDGGADWNPSIMRPAVDPVVRIFYKDREAIVNVHYPLNSKRNGLYSLKREVVHFLTKPIPAIGAGTKFIRDGKELIYEDIDADGMSICRYVKDNSIVFITLSLEELINSQK